MSKRRTDLLSLPAGTQFYVINGAWYGEIVEQNGAKCLKNEKGVMPITKGNRYTLNICILEQLDDIDDDDLPF